MRLTLRQLEYFIATGDAGSIKLASETINVSQPAISTAISDLEETLGVQLLIRHHAQGVTLTPEGRRLLVEAKALIAQAGNLHVLAEEFRHEIAGPLTVGSLVTIAPIILPGLIRSFTEQHPGASVAPREADQEDLYDMLRHGEIDIAISYDLEVPSDLLFQPIVALEPYAYFSREHRLARRKTIRLAEVADEGLVLLDLPLSRDYFLSLFLSEGLRPRIALRSRHLEVVRGLVANGIGYGLGNIPLKTGTALDGRPIVTRPLSGNYRPMVLGLVTVERKMRRRVVEAFEAHCKSVLAGLL
ncbi:MAG: LysR substrate-binding domain-containing protein [Hyphomicrobiaceae bacterium]